MTRRALEQCVEDAQEIDGCGRRNALLQRQLDAGAGREQILVAQLSERDVMIETLKRRPTWGAALELLAIGLSAGLCTGAVRGDKELRLPCAVSVATAAAGGVALWRW